MATEAFELSRDHADMAGRSNVSPLFIATLATGIFLAGLGTALLGPILPLLAAQWHMTDAQSGNLLLAKFIASFVGGITVFPQLRRSLLLGAVACAAGFGTFAYASGAVSGSAALAVAGFGIGQTIAGTNILMGRLFPDHRGSAISALNFAFALGAILSSGVPIWLTPHLGLRAVLVGFAALFLPQASLLLSQSAVGVSAETTATGETAIPRSAFFYYAALLVLYGAVETGLSAWLTTFGARFGHAGIAGGAYLTLVLWIALTAGRAGSSVLMLRLRELPTQRYALGFCTVAIVAVALAPGGWPSAVLVMLLGALLAPIFPATWALLLAEKPSARQAGAVLAASGIGAAALPWLMGQVSTLSGDLRMALLLPAVCTALMLALSATRRPPQVSPVEGV